MECELISSLLPLSPSLNVYVVFLCGVKYTQQSTYFGSLANCYSKKERNYRQRFSRLIVEKPEIYISLPARHIGYIILYKSQQ